MDYAVIVASGAGKRMGGTLPKQFMPLCGKPILMHTIEAFHRYDPAVEIILVLPQSYVDFWQDCCREHQFRLPHRITTGGAERFHSVQCGLALIHDHTGLTAVHDGARPFADKALIARCYAEALTKGAAIPACPVTESLRTLKGDRWVHVERTLYHTIQTPQVFHTDLLLRAYAQAYDPSFTDDASVVEAAGHAVSLVEGDDRNLKITHPKDLPAAETLLRHLQSQNML